MDSFERELERVLNESVELPAEYQYMIRNALKNRKKVKINHKFFKMVTAACGCAVIVTSAVLAKNTFHNFYNFNEGMDKAIENGYIEEPKVKSVQSNGIEARIEDYLMDDFNFSFTVAVKLDDSIDASKILRAILSNFIITDEEKRILYCDNREVFDEYVKENQLDYQFAEHNENYINNGINAYMKEKDTQTNELKIVYNLNTPNKYPKSKSLKFQFSTINLSGKPKEMSENGEMETVLTGNWQIDLEVPEKFYNRESMTYHVKSCSNEKINVTEAEVYDTCMKLKFTMPVKKIYDEGDSEEEIERKMSLKSEEMFKKREELIESFGEITEENQDEFMKRDEDFMSLFGSYSSRKPYVETETGKNISGDVGYSDSWSEGELKGSATFPLTKQEATDHLKIYLQYNPDYSGNWEEICIELER